MDTNAYASRKAHAHDRMASAAAQIAAVDGYADVAEIVAGARHKDKDTAYLFQAEAFAKVLELIAASLTKPAKAAKRSKDE